MNLVAAILKRIRMIEHFFSKFCILRPFSNENLVDFFGFYFSLLRSFDFDFSFRFGISHVEIKVDWEKLRPESNPYATELAKTDFYVNEVDVAIEFEHLNHDGLMAVFRRSWKTKCTRTTIEKEVPCGQLFLAGS